LPKMSPERFERTTLRPEELINSTAKLSGVTLLGKTLALVRGYVTAWFLGPHAFGVLSILGMINTYASFMHIGLTDAARRELPYLIARNDTEGTQKVRDNAFSVHILTAILVAGAVWAASYWFADLTIRWAIRITALTIFLSRIRNLYSLLAYVYSKFGAIARCNALGAVISFIFVVCTIYWLKIFSVILVLLIAEIWIIFYLKRSVNLNFRFSVSWPEVWHLARIGVWLVLSTVSYYIFNLTDRTMVAGLLGVEAVGYYALAFFFFNILHQFVGTGVSVIQPQLYRRLGEVESVKEVKNYITKPSLLSAFVCSFLAGMIWICSPWFIELFLPKFAPSVQSMQILVVSLFFVAVSKMPQQLLPAPRVNRQKQMVVAYFVGIVINMGLNLFFIKKLGFGIEGAAWATLIANGFVCVFLFILAHRFYWKNVSEAVPFYLELVIPIVWMVLLIAVVNISCKGDPANVVVAFPKAVLYLVGFLPCLWYFNRRTGLLTLFINVLSSGIGKNLIRSSRQ